MTRRVRPGPGAALGFQGTLSRVFLALGTAAVGSPPEPSAGSRAQRAPGLCAGSSGVAGDGSIPFAAPLSA